MTSSSSSSSSVEGVGGRVDWVDECTGEILPLGEATPSRSLRGDNLEMWQINVFRFRKKGTI